MSTKNYTYAEIAADRRLWDTYVDPSGTTTDAEWEAGTVASRVAEIERCFGPESDCSDATTARDQIKAHLDSLPRSALLDIAGGKWDELMTDRLYSAVGAAGSESMSVARSVAEEIAQSIVSK